MSIRRQFNALNQQRFDRPSLLSIESSIQNDFDELLTALVTGLEKSFFIRGFELEMSGAIGGSASGLQVIVDDGAILHGNSNTSGTFYLVESGASNEILNSNSNVLVDGSFTPSSLNYVGIDFERNVDDATTALSQFWNPTTKTEFSKTVPQAKILKYKFVITNSVFAANVLPLAVIETDSSNNVVSIEDRRPMLLRLGTAGDTTPDPSYEYPWNNDIAGRAENFYKSTSNSSSPFLGGDKQLKSLKEWLDAAMSMIKEIKGTSYWYSGNSGGSLLKFRADVVNTIMTGTGSISHDAAVPGKLNWDSDIFFNLIGSRLTYKVNSNAATSHVVLNDDEVAYITLVRDEAITPNLIFTNGSAVVTSVAAVSWTSNVLANDWIKLASADDTKYYQILSVDSASQVTLTSNYSEVSTGSGGTQAQYAWGVYQTNAAPSTNRHIRIADRKDVPFNENILWLWTRQDNGAVLARVYSRGNGIGELEQGESIEISDNTSNDVLEYIGSPAENVSEPDYTNSLVTGVAEVTTIDLVPASDITTGDYWYLNSANNVNKYYVWYNKDVGGGDPLLPNMIGIEVAVTTGDLAVVVAASSQAAIDALGDFDCVDNLDGSITVTNSQVGTADNATNGNMGGAFAITVDVSGAGSYNTIIIDTENLTKSIKRLDDEIKSINQAIDVQEYEETLTIVSGAPANDNEFTGPVLVGTTLTLPLNSRDSDYPQGYIVGSGDLQVYLNGVRITLGDDYTEVGIAGDASREIDIQFQLEIDDIILFEIVAASGNNGSGSAYTGANLGSNPDARVFKQLAGTEFQFRRLAAGTNITLTETANTVIIAATGTVAASNIVTYSANQSITSANDIVLVDTASSNVTITLPSAVSCGGKIFYIKKLKLANTLFVKSVSAQTLDDVDIDASPYALSVQYETITITSDGSAFYIL